MTASSREFRIGRHSGAATSVVADRVAVEEPLEIQVASSNSAGAAAKSVSITMRTPGYDEELAVGFLFTEGIVRAPEDVTAVELVGEKDDATGLKNRIRVMLSPDARVDLSRLERHFYTTSSCGVCGKASLDALQIGGAESLHGKGATFDAAMLVDLPNRIRQKQPVFAETGGLHAAALFGSDGETLIVREDVGRHNATDKVVGAMLGAQEIPGNQYGLFVSGRASFELMQKTLMAGVPMLAAVGAPSSLAVETAEAYGMSLVGFLRDGGFNIYAGEQRIQ